MSESNPSRQPMRSPRGATITCKGWRQEAALRLLMNCADPEVAERPEDLVITGTVKAARDWESFHDIVASLRTLENDQTLKIKAGNRAGISPSDPEAPRVIIESAHWNASHARGGCFIPGQAAGGWTYVGAQSALPVDYETFAAAARKHFGGTLAGRLVTAGGMGGIGSAQPLAATLNGAAFLGIDADSERIKRRVKSGYCDVMVNDLDEALRILKNAVRKREATSVGLIGNCADIIPGLAQRGVVPDLVTDQTSADDPANGYIPQGLTPREAAQLGAQDSDACRERALDSIASHVRGMIELRRLGAIAFEFGNSLFMIARDRSARDAVDISESASEYLQPLLTEGLGVVTWAALSGEPADIARADRLSIELFPEDDRLRRWIALAGRHVRYQGLPARTCWLSPRQTAQFASELNRLVARQELRAPLVIASGPFDSGATAAPSSWVWSEGDGLSGQALVLDGTPELSARIDSGLPLATTQPNWPDRQVPDTPTGSRPL